MRCLSNMAEIILRISYTVVLANYIVDSYCSLGRLGSDALKLLVAIAIRAAPIRCRELARPDE